MKNKLMILAGLFSLSTLNAMEPMSAHQMKVLQERVTLANLEDIIQQAQALKALVKRTDKFPRSIADVINAARNTLELQVGLLQSSAAIHPKN
jgi:DNA repair ATPase RecN